MLQQTQVKTVIPFWERWMRELPTIEAAANASSDKLHKLWEGLGYYTRVRNLQYAAQMIVAVHGGKFPDRFDDVLALPGIGRYTAGAICSIAYNQPTPILDGNVIRVLTRVFGIAENPKEKEINNRLWQLAAGLVASAAGDTQQEAGSRTRTRTKYEEDGCSCLNQSLMELGALVCTPRNAQCTICPVKELCVAFREKRVEELPNLGQRQQATARRFVAFVVERNGKFLVRQRPAGVVNGHLWEFPNVEVGARVVPTRSGIAKTGCVAPTPGDSNFSPAADGDNPHSVVVANAVKEVLGFALSGVSPLVTVKHSITRYRITLEAFKLEAGKGAFPKNGGVWKTPAQMHALAFTSAHRKVLLALA